MTAAGADGQVNVDGQGTGAVASTARPLSAWAWFGIGVASALVGLLPWIITGLRLPLQNLWATDALPDQMPIVLLPFSQYAVTLVAGILVIGAATAGLVARSTRARQGRRGFVALTIGVFTAQLIAIVQTSLVVQQGVLPGRESSFYLVAVVAVAVTSFLVGVLVFAMIARMPRAGALIGLTLAAIAVGWWAGALILPDPVFVTDAQSTLLGLLRWLPAILCGVAIAWCGVATIGRILAVITALAAIVIGPAFATAVTSAAGTRVLARYPAEMLDYGLQVFQSALTTPALTLRPLLTAIIVAIVLFVLQALRRRRSA